MPKFTDNYLRRVCETCRGISRNEACRRLGIAGTSLRRALRAARAKGFDVPASGQPHQSAGDKETEKGLRDALRVAVEQAERARSVRPIEPFKKQTRRKPKIKTTVVCADLHGNFMDRQAVDAMLSDITALNPDAVIMLGDMLECGGWLAKHHTMGYVSEVDQVSYEDDIAATNWFLDELATAAPRAACDYLEGNHEQRIERWCVDQTLGNGDDAEMLRRLISPEVVLKLKERGIKYHRMSVHHDGMNAPGVIKRGLCYYTHGWFANRHAAAKHAEKCGGNITYGHTHRADYMPIRTMVDGVHAAWCPGCLCRLQPLWKNTQPADWTHGYLVRFEADNGEFQTIQVPIIDGKSFMGPVIDMLRGNK